mmetsp:Transcript_10705/g.15764  ORF Transcript_10705/g.15764 Transcript_10705/m.15764 type:complete len:228 (-) Transcript_10705:68-751(-)
MKLSFFMILASAPAIQAFVPLGRFSTRIQQQQTQQQPDACIKSQTKAIVMEMSTSDVESDIGRDAEMVFSVVDVDGNGFISHQELTNHLTKAGYTSEVIDKIFAKLDVNKDDEVSCEEFTKGLQLMSALRSAPGLGNYNANFVKEIHEDADSLFRSVDADNSGGIDEFELKSHMSRMFSNYSEEAMERIFKMLDVDGNGKISKDELRDAFVRYSALRQAIGEGPNYK